MKNSNKALCSIAIITVILVLMVGCKNPKGSDAPFIEMVRISAGSFTMGSSEMWDAEPHSVSFSYSFYIGKYLVTQAQYLEVMGKNPSFFTGNLNRPVERVTWFDAVEFCNELSIKEGFAPVYTISGSIVTPNWNANGYRLPTEAEWEYACRAGTTTTWSHNESMHNNYMWFTDNSGYTTHPVGTKLANPWGLFDMHGNVWEWCWDWYGAYNPEKSNTNPVVGADSGIDRVNRGGAMNSIVEVARSAHRGRHRPQNHTTIHGFRVVRSGS